MIFTSDIISSQTCVEDFNSCLPNLAIVTQANSGKICDEQRAALKECTDKHDACPAIPPTGTSVLTLFKINIDACQDPTTPPPTTGGLSVASIIEIALAVIAAGLILGGSIVSLVRFYSNSG